MLEINGNLWDFHNAGHHIGITTNGFVKKNGKAVMGRGCALEASQRFKDLPEQLGTIIKEMGNHVHLFETERLISIPVKHNWWEPADIELIKRSCEELVSFGEIDFLDGPIYIPRPGCGNGHLDWLDVKPYIEFLPDKFVVVTYDLPYLY